MMINLDWEKLKKVHKQLIETPTLSDDTNIIFIMVMSDHKAKKAKIKFKDFMRYFWAIAENKEYEVAALIVQDEEGRILYRHKTLTAGNEEIPVGGNGNVILHWSSLTQNEKNTYIRILESQVQGYDH